MQSTTCYAEALLNLRIERYEIDGVPYQKVELVAKANSLTDLNHLLKTLPPDSWLKPFLEDAIAVANRNQITPVLGQPMNISFQGCGDWIDALRIPDEFLSQDNLCGKVWTFAD